MTQISDLAEQLRAIWPEVNWQWYHSWGRVMQGYAPGGVIIAIQPEPLTVQAGIIGESLQPFLATTSAPDLAAACKLVVHAALQRRDIMPGLEEFLRGPMPAGIPKIDWAWTEAEDQRKAEIAELTARAERAEALLSWTEPRRGDIDALMKDLQGRIDDFKALTQRFQMASDGLSDILPSHRPIYAAIDRERAFQVQKWGDVPRDVGGYLTLLGRELREAVDAYATQPGDAAALEEVLQVATLAVACLRQHGVHERLECRPVAAQEAI